MSIPITDRCRRCRRELLLFSERFGCRICFEAGYVHDVPTLCRTCLDVHRMDVHDLEPGAPIVPGLPFDRESGGSGPWPDPQRGQVSSPFEIAAGTERPLLNKSGGSDVAK